MRFRSKLAALVPSLVSSLAAAFLVSAHVLAELPNGVVPVAAEPSHKIRFDNGRIRVYEVLLSAGEQTLFHQHSADSVTLAFARTHIRNEFYEAASMGLDVRPQDIGYTSTEAGPYSHRVVVDGDQSFHVMAVELMSSVGTSANTLLRDDAVFRLEQDKPRARVYRMKLAPGQSTPTYNRHSGTFVVAMTPGRISRNYADGVKQLWDFETADARWVAQKEQLMIRNESDHDVELVEIEVY